MLRLAVSSTPEGRWLGKQAEAALNAAGVACSLLEWRDAPQHALLRGDADAVAIWLSDWPPAQGDEPVAVAAILSRAHPFDLLVWRPEAADLRKDFFLKKEAVVLGATTLQRAQIAEFRPDLHWEEPLLALPEALQRLSQGAAEALITSEAAWHASGANLNGFQRAVLHPRECTPAPGQGALALLARRDDKPTRQWLQRAHQPALSACTNVERRLLREIQKHWPGAIFSAYVEQGANRTFHFFTAVVWPNGCLQRYRLSHSTHAEFVEQTLRHFQESSDYSRT
ncbi:MAG: hypothetical protein RMJ33_07010 [Saprospiraceae bacterium]|nr:hypothetical protein [Saprospiraceae bacterium]MDW8229570.1 hypothetical protein [Saprospiraceae bacterium]